MASGTFPGTALGALVASTRWIDDKPRVSTGTVAPPCHVSVLPSGRSFRLGADMGGTQAGVIGGNGAMRLKGQIGGGSG